jgi:uncharacterized protein YyaL (SSP411 family)
LFTGCQDEKWIQWADELQQKQDQLFWDPSQGGYFSSAAGDPSILIRLKEGTYKSNRIRLGFISFFGLEIWARPDLLPNYSRRIFGLFFYPEQDGAEPSGNSIAVGNLERLAVAVDRSDYRDQARRTLCLFQDRLAKIPVSLPEMVAALQLHQGSPTEV